MNGRKTRPYLGLKTVRNAQVKKDMDFPEALCYGIEQQNFLLQRKIEMDDDTYDEDAVVEDETNIDNTIKKPRWSDPRDSSDNLKSKWNVPRDLSFVKFYFAF